ncbi:alpha-N-acetylglucosaminidase [Sunxiuqinia elliptica]|uniref:Alpha-N-acetylglucosaminidase n=1 Tax=Sunxiuqinia elliptica TaxID=655355 RepID=A0A4R6GPV1_9BACT|nr:alpha-N-acetylglucosaminidase [Sunxiuqinia elliptica]TDN96650.1 alpha-N-acetylglucosaminidase [Sunxiuqinia elliptica]TDO55791.1 alpha-N-acetylglucosaminidase [Sunxiuqinia elliptica]
MKIIGEMKYSLVFIWILVLSIGVHANQQVSVNKKNEKTIVHSARGVLSRVLGEKAASIQLRIHPIEDGTDTYEYECINGKLKVKGSSVSALTRGVYDYLKTNHLGMLDWAGPQFSLPEIWPDAPKTNVTTPFKIRHAYNAVTSGYTTPYWDWKRWEQELDWQAVHGFNMLMVSVGTEAIAMRVWKKLGLTDEEIEDFYGGPAHMPWHRMGCVQDLGGYLPPEWHEDQISLQHKILARMRELGMTPVVQSFGGFVPKAIARIYPDVELHSTLWNAGFPPEKRPVLLGPDQDLFATITKMYMEEWQKEFGKEDYYLVDSFNELQLPESDKPVTELLAEYGEKTYKAVKSGNPDAVWVIQGWMFAYQRYIWNPETVEALFSRVPDDEVIILDYANDYNNNWEPMNSFNGKQWVYGFVPNMGGKTAYTGDLHLYASGAARALHSPNKKNLVGFTISGEGLENNNVVYELLADVAWSNDSIDLDNWLDKYSMNRYGGCPRNMNESWKLLRESCYSNLVPHPQFGWQLGRCRIGSVNNDPKFYEATLKFLSCSEELGSSANYQADAIERAALSLGLKADEWFVVASDAYQQGDTQTGYRAGARGLELLTELDRLMESHPLNRLERWLEFTTKHGDDEALKRFYEVNARWIITVWGPPVNDYACRVWSGLVRDFYRERMRHVLQSLKNGEKFASVPWEIQWAEGSGISKIEPYADPVTEAVKLVKEALSEPLPEVKKATGESIGEWSPANVGDEWQVVEWPLTVAQLKAMNGVTFVYTRGNHRLDIREVSVIADGKVVATDQHEGFAGKPNHKNHYRFNISSEVSGNNGCSIRAVVKCEDGTESYGRVELMIGK